VAVLHREGEANFGAEKWETFVSICKEAYRIDLTATASKRPARASFMPTSVEPIWKRFDEGALYGGISKLLGNAPKRDFLYTLAQSPG